MKNTLNTLQGMSVKLRDAEGATLLQKACSSAVPLSRATLWHSAELEILGAEATHSGRIPILKLITEKGGNLNAKAL